MHHQLMGRRGRLSSAGRGGGQISLILPFAVCGVIGDPEGKECCEEAEVDGCHMHKAALVELLDILRKGAGMPVLAGKSG